MRTLVSAAPRKCFQSCPALAEAGLCKRQEYIYGIIEKM